MSEKKKSPQEQTANELSHDELDEVAGGIGGITKDMTYQRRTNVLKSPPPRGSSLDIPSGTTSTSDANDLLDDLASGPGGDTDSTKS